MSTTPEREGRKLLRIEKKNAQTPIEKKPEWIRTTAKAGKEYKDMRSLSIGRGLHTVCAEAGCPNIYECWEDREATFLIGGAYCTRRCDFCDIATARPTEYDTDEPERVSQSVSDLGLKYATITGVARDDLPDGAAWLYAETCRLIHEKCPDTGVELLVDDMKAHESALAEVFSSKPEVFGHNLETVPRIFKKIRPAFRYERSLEVINAASEAGLITKSNLILGMGETREEIENAMFDLAESGCHLLTLTQYLRPSPLHHPIDRWVHPEEFISLSAIAKEMGFLGVMAGPMVRSSYRAGRLWGEAMKKLGRPIPDSLSHLAEEGSTMQEASSLLAKRPHLRGGQSIQVGPTEGETPAPRGCASMKKMAAASAQATRPQPPKRLQLATVGGGSQGCCSGGSGGCACGH
ncbi:lipoyl synthase [Actinomycetaceae bacterium TAE3-ERU4]|nr:lipoyl synthase [Actinomycetaceae bacterium TAE3-ERU4]